MTGDNGSAAGYKFLLCTDLDRTLLPNGPEPESPGCRELFKTLADSTDVALAYVSGRDEMLVDAAISDFDLPIPDFAVTDVGTRILRRRSGDWQDWSAWTADISVSWAGYENAALSDLLADIGPLQLQEAARQNTYKLSYYLPPQADRAELQDEILGRLSDTPVQASLVWSVDDLTGAGLLDILPKRASKLHAIDFLRQQLRISLNQMLFAGDSGNDLQVLESPVPAVLVANATAAVRQEAEHRAQHAGHGQSLYLARGGYLGMNGNYSAGILEGMNHFYPEMTAELLAERAR